MNTKICAGFLTTVSLLGVVACADLNGGGYPYGNNQGGYGNSGYGNNGYGNGYGNNGYGNNGGYGYGNSGYGSDQRYREREWERQQALERERDRLEDERRRLEDQRRREHEEYNNSIRVPPSQVYNPRPAPQAETCPSGFQDNPSGRRCSDSERKHGCKDMRMPGGKTCISR